VRGCGRTDFQEGDAGKLWDSVHARLFSLPDATLVYPAHDYRGMTVSTIGEEKRHNPRLGGTRTRPEFVELMAALDLPPPAKIAEALPANRACGDVGTGPDPGPPRM
jgi:glyoxylase-like metal-dependent hydrolase (beta-lactamase superfamily II)